MDRLLTILRVFVIGLLCLSLPTGAFAQTQGQQAQAQLQTRVQTAPPLTETPPLPTAPLPHPQAIAVPLSPPPNASAAPSALESAYSARVVSPLVQFGYEVFTPQASSLFGVFPAATGRIHDSYRLGVGDTLDITLSGAVFNRYSADITSDGMLIIEGLPPLLAAGRNLGEVRHDLQAMAQEQLGAQAYLRVSSLRQIEVLIAGHVKDPGLKRLSALHSVLNALQAAGGINKTGSLRQIKLIRGGEQTLIDLYDVLLAPSSDTALSGDLLLQDGDRLIIPPIGPTLAISGDVKRPGIYEMLPALRGMYYKPGLKADKLSLNEALGLAGGVLTQGALHFLSLTYDANGQEVIDVITEDHAHDPLLADSAILTVSTNQSKRSGQIEVLGETRLAGLHALSQYKTLGSLLSNTQALGDDTYPLLGLLRRWSPETLSYTLSSFPLRLVLKGEYDQRLFDGDQLIFLSNGDIAALQDSHHSQANDSASLTESETDPQTDVQDTNKADAHAGNKTVLDPATQAFLKERALFVRGAVQSPGLYPISETETLQAILAAAGGMSLEASERVIELIRAYDPMGGAQRRVIDLTRESANNVIVQAGDSVRVNQRFHKIADNSVLILGEIAYPGRYDLMPGEHLSDLLARAGGLSDQAYAQGSIFSRASERRAEENRFQSEARMIRQAIATAMHDTSAKDNRAVSSAQIAEARALAAELEHAKGIGRITVEADPAILATQPELDLLLEGGDRIFVPRRSLTVRVSGEVLAPAALQFRDNKKPRDYIDEAGGYAYHADQDRSFVIFPDGSAQPLRISAWTHDPVFIPPGSTIIVPRDPKPFDFIERFKDVTKILSNLAVTAIFIDDVRDD